LLSELLSVTSQGCRITTIIRRQAESRDLPWVFQPNNCGLGLVTFKSPRHGAGDHMEPDKVSMMPWFDVNPFSLTQNVPPKQKKYHKPYWILNLNQKHQKQYNQKHQKTIQFWISKSINFISKIWFTYAQSWSSKHSANIKSKTLTKRETPRFQNRSISF
jgi:hypothetical protein